jgi:sugar phosphate isomerase/epimerase
MKIGMVTDSLGHLGFDEMLDTAASMGVQGVEFNACNWTSAPHMNLAELLVSVPARKDFLTAIQKRGL